MCTNSVLRTSGLFWDGPVFSVWYPFLDRVATGISRGNMVKHVLVKLFGEQIVYEPLMLCGEFTAMGIAERRKLSDIKERLMLEYWDTYKKDVMFWVTVQSVNFSLTPVMFQPLVVSSASVVWMMFLSYKQHKPLERGQNNEQSSGLAIQGVPSLTSMWCMDRVVHLETTDS